VEKKFSKKRGVVRVKYTQYRQKDIVVRVLKENGKRILCPEYGTGKK